MKMLTVRCLFELARLIRMHILLIAVQFDAILLCSCSCLSVCDVVTSKVFFLVMWSLSCSPSAYCDLLQMLMNTSVAFENHNLYMGFYLTAMISELNGKEKK